MTNYLQVDFPTLIASGRAKKLVSVFTRTNVELLVDHETETYCLAPGRFPGA